jgi:hypothetical protein
LTFLFYPPIRSDGERTNKERQYVETLYLSRDEEAVTAVLLLSFLVEEDDPTAPHTAGQ